MNIIAIVAGLFLLISGVINLTLESNKSNLTDSQKTEEIKPKANDLRIVPEGRKWVVQTYTDWPTWNHISSITYDTKEEAEYVMAYMGKTYRKN